MEEVPQKIIPLRLEFVHNRKKYWKMWLSGRTRFEAALEHKLFKVELYCLGIKVCEQSADQSTCCGKDKKHVLLRKWKISTPMTVWYIEWELSNFPSRGMRVKWNSVNIYNFVFLRTNASERNTEDKQKWTSASGGIGRRNSLEYAFRKLQDKGKRIAFTFARDCECTCVWNGKISG